VDVGDLGDEVLGHGRPVGLVFLVFTMSTGRTLGIEDNGEQGGCFVLDDLQQHVGEAEDGIRRQAGRGAETAYSIKRAVNI